MLLFILYNGISIQIITSYAYCIAAKADVQCNMLIWQSMPPMRIASSLSHKYSMELL